MRAAIAALCLCGSGCIAAGGEDTEPFLDREAYAAYVHPVVEPSCATLDCHGAPGRPLRLYAETGLRASDALRLDDAPISDDEIDANVLSFAAVDLDEPRLEHRLSLTKPLAEPAGGVEHVGGDVWLSTTDPSYRCVAGWLDGRAGEVEWETACADAIAEVGLLPP